MSSIGAELPRQMVRLAVRLVQDRAIPAGVVEFSLAALERAGEAVATQDVIACVRSHQELKALGA